MPKLKIYFRQGVDPIIAKSVAIGLMRAQGGTLNGMAGGVATGIYENFFWGKLPRGYERYVDAIALDAI